MKRLLIGGSPCTFWSIAQTKNRETEASGMGWELFKNFLIALEKYKPDYFLYENNKSMSAAIRAQITEELGVEPILINSALVSAQSRQRLYWVGKRNPDGTYSRVPVEQPEDLGILLRDILESGVCWTEKSYCLKAQYSHGIPDNDMLKRRQNTQVAEPVNITTDGKAQCLRATYYKDGVRNMVGNTVDRKTCVAEPVRIGTIESGTQTEHDSKPFRVYSPDGKGVTLQGEAGGYGAKTGLYAVPKDCDVVITDNSIRCQRRDKKHSTVQGSHVNFEDGKSQTLSPSHIPMVISATDEKKHTIYEVKDGKITIKGQQFPIRLADGFYIIRKLTVRECMRLQTVPEGYIFPVSDTQAYKMLGNGWTVDVIAHIMSHFEGITTERVEVLSMYDGMSCGHIALDKLGATVDRYYATEIDKYAIKTTMENYPDTIQLGDAFQVREAGWLERAAQTAGKEF